MRKTGKAPKNGNISRYLSNFWHFPNPPLETTRIKTGKHFTVLWKRFPVLGKYTRFCFELRRRGAVCIDCDLAEINPVNSIENSTQPNAMETVEGRWSQRWMWLGMFLINRSCDMVQWVVCDNTFCPLSMARLHGLCDSPASEERTHANVLWYFFAQFTPQLFLSEQSKFFVAFGFAVFLSGMVMTNFAPLSRLLHCNAHCNYVMLPTDVLGAYSSRIWGSRMGSKRRTAFAMRCWEQVRSTPFYTYGFIFNSISDPSLWAANINDMLRG